MCIVEIEASTIPEQIARNNTFDNIAGIEKSVIVYFGFFFSSHELLCFVCGNLKLFGFRDIEFQNVDIWRAKKGDLTQETSGISSLSRKIIDQLSRGDIINHHVRDDVYIP